MDAAHSPGPSSRSNNSISPFQEFSDLSPGPNPDDFQTVLLSFTSILERNEINMRMLKHKLKTIVEVLIPLETLSCILSDMDQNLQKLETEIGQVKEFVFQSCESIQIAQNTYRDQQHSAEASLQLIIEQESENFGSDFKEKLTQQILLGLFRNEEGRKHLISIREQQKEATKAKAKAIGVINMCKKNLQALDNIMKVVDKVEVIDMKYKEFKEKIFDIYKFQQQMKSSIDSIESSQTIDVESLNSKVISLISTFKNFQYFYLEVASIRNEIMKKEKIISINEKIGQLMIDLESEEAATDLLHSQYDELKNELDEKLNEFNISTAHDLFLANGQSVRVVEHEIKKNQVVDEEKMLLRESSTASEDLVSRFGTSKKSQKTLKLEHDISRIKLQLDKIKEELLKKRDLQEQLDQMVTLQHRFENENIVQYNTINQYLAKTCEKYQIIINHMSRSSNVFAPETTTALIGVLCEYLSISQNRFFFHQFCFKKSGIRSEISLKELYKHLASKIYEKLPTRLCLFFNSYFDIVHSSSVLDINEIINLLFNQDLLGCIKTERESNGIDIITVEAIYSKLVEMIRKLSEIIVLQRQIQVKINYEENLRVLDKIKQEATERILSLGYNKLAGKLGSPRKMKKIKYQIYSL